MNIEGKMHIFRRPHLKTKLAIATLGVSLLLVGGCSKSKTTTQAMTAPEVEVVQVEQRDVPIYQEWIGTLDGLVNAEIKSQVTGYLLKQHYTEGSFVRKGQLLFELDPRPFEATLEQAKGDRAKAQGQLEQANAQLIQAQAQLSQAEANQGKTELDVQRYTPLAKEKAISAQDLDNAVQANLAAKAQVRAANAGIQTAKAGIVAAKATITAAEATVKSAEINLGFTKIYSLIDGIAGLAQVQVGNLVNGGNNTLTTVSTVDPIKVYFTPSEQEYLTFIRNNPTAKAQADMRKNLELELVLVDGTLYPQKGRFFFADRQVDQKTGAIRLAGTFPNPGNVLRPGQYGKVRAVTSTRGSALLVPQRAVTELQGNYQVAVVGSDSKVNIRTIKVGERIDTLWIIDEGLKAGETVIVEGLQKVRPDTVVTTRPYAAPATTEAQK
jgi:membrane fusion protein (multidrug efflux system)